MSIRRYVLNFGNRYPFNDPSDEPFQNKLGQS